LYGRARIGDFIVNLISSPASSRWAVVLLAVALMALGGCGRKGGLDLPPNSPPQPAATAAQSDADANKAGLFNPSGVDAPPTAPKGPKKPFVLDPLLNSN
jgi:predicted small lipoprotein YifL